MAFILIEGIISIIIHTVNNKNEKTNMFLYLLENYQSVFKKIKD